MIEFVAEFQLFSYLLIIFTLEFSYGFVNYVEPAKNGTKFSYVQYNYLILDLTTTHAANLIDNTRKKTNDGISRRMDGQFN